jgi:hypothetical protein
MLSAFFTADEFLAVGIAPGMGMASCAAKQLKQSVKKGVLPLPLRSL